MNKKIEYFLIKTIEETGLTRKVIEQLVKDKQNEFKGLISDEGAYYLVMRELGIITSIIPEDNIMPKTDKEVIEEEVNEIREENEGLYEIMQTDLYKALFQIFKRCTIKVEIQNIDQISTATGEKTTTKPKTKKSTGVKKLTFAEVEELENSYMVTNDEGKIAFIGNGLIDKVVDTTIHFTFKASKWFNESKIKWKENEPFEE